jgi:hypothetical protein
MFTLTCGNCGDVFLSEVEVDKCPECEQHGRLFDDILADIASTSSSMERGPITVFHPTAEEAGIPESRTWRDDFRDLLNHLRFKDVTNIRDFTLLITAMGWTRTRVSPWHSVIIVTHIYNRNPKMCERREMLLDENLVAYYHFTTFFNPFRYLYTSHPGMAKFITKQDTTFVDLVEKADAFLKEETN